MTLSKIPRIAVTACFGLLLAISLGGVSCDELTGSGPVPPFRAVSGFPNVYGRLDDSGVAHSDSRGTAYEMVDPASKRRYQAQPVRDASGNIIKFEFTRQGEIDRVGDQLGGGSRKRDGGGGGGGGGGGD